MTVSRTAARTIHVIAQCCDCEWRSEDYRAGPDLARKHADKTRHTVMVERVQSWTYNPKKK